MTFISIILAIDNFQILFLEINTVNITESSLVPTNEVIFQQITYIDPLGTSGGDKNRVYNNCRFSCNLRSFKNFR